MQPSGKVVRKVAGQELGGSALQPTLAQPFWQPHFGALLWTRAWQPRSRKRAVGTVEARKVHMTTNSSFSPSDAFHWETPSRATTTVSEFRLASVPSCLQRQPCLLINDDVRSQRLGTLAGNAHVQFIALPRPRTVILHDAVRRLANKGANVRSGIGIMAASR